MSKVWFCIARYSFTTALQQINLNINFNSRQGEQDEKEDRPREITASAGGRQQRKKWQTKHQDKRY
jgi:hypothetical protein